MYFITCHLFGVIIIASIVHLLALAFDARPGVLPFEQQDWCAGAVISSRDVATRSQNHHALVFILARKSKKVSL
jgi:hypothetical protein